ncbi:IS66 family insertion sequence element accessory protein TnpA [Clostridium sp.]|uniref:IS66 family insertion sequence element accessory protein TnpA n=1 Tax=Clostridium sp. TaxID=1506 RepID=UPI003F3636FF
MANAKLDIDKIFKLVMACRQSGMSDRQWCIEHDIHPSTFYYWVKKLRNHACYDIPENTYHSSNNDSPSCIIKQDVVKVDLVSAEPTLSYTPVQSMNSTPVVIQYQEANILIQDNFNPNTLKDVLRTLKEALC